MRYSEIINESKSPAAVEAILKRFGQLLYGRAETDQTCPDEVVSVEEDNGKYVLQHIMDADPTPKGIYVNWIVREYLKGNIARFEDLGRVYAALGRYNALKPKLAPEHKDVIRLTWDALQELVEQNEDTDVRSEAYKEKEFERSLIDTGQAKIVQNDSDLKIIEIHSEDAAKFYGRNTRWCTAGEHNNMFSSYYVGNKPLVVLLFKKENRRYQFHFSSNQYMDEKDRPLASDIMKGLINRSPYLRTQAILNARTRYIDHLEVVEIESLLSNPQAAFEAIASSSKLAEMLGPSINRMFEPDYIERLDDVSSTIAHVAMVSSDLLDTCPTIKPSDLVRLFGYNPAAITTDIVSAMHNTIYVSDDQDRLEYMSLLREMIEGHTTKEEYEFAFHRCIFRDWDNYEDAIKIYGKNVVQPYAITKKGDFITSFKREDFSSILIEKQTPVWLVVLLRIYNSLRENTRDAIPAKEIAKMNVKVGNIRALGDRKVLTKDDAHDLAVFCPKLMNDFVRELVNNDSSLVELVSEPVTITLGRAYSINHSFGAIVEFLVDHIAEYGEEDIGKIVQTVPELGGLLRLAKML